MPVLPLIDLMLLSGWTSLLVGFVLKVIYLTTGYRPTILTLTPIDFLMIAVASMLFAIAIAARTWVASQSPAQSAKRRREETLAAYRVLPGAEEAETDADGLGSARTEVVAAASQAGRAGRG